MEWIKISEILPANESYVLATNGQWVGEYKFTETKIKYRDVLYAPLKTKYEFKFMSAGCDDCSDDLDKVTHWMFLPNMPKD